MDSENKEKESSLNNDNSVNDKGKVEKKSCSCEFTCCDYAVMYNKCNEKLQHSVIEIVNLRKKIDEMYEQRLNFENRIYQNITLKSANALLIILNVLNSIIENNNIKDLVELKDCAMFNACTISVQQIHNVLINLYVYLIVPVSGEKYNPELHNAVSTVNNTKLENQTIVYVIEIGAYYKKGELASCLVRPAVVIVNIC